MLASLTLFQPEHPQKGPLGAPQVPEGRALHGQPSSGSLPSHHCSPWLANCFPVGAGLGENHRAERLLGSPSMHSPLVRISNVLVLQLQSACSVPGLVNQALGMRPLRRGVWFRKQCSFGFCLLLGDLQQLTSPPCWVHLSKAIPSLSSWKVGNLVLKNQTHSRLN